MGPFKVGVFFFSAWLTMVFWGIVAPDLGLPTIGYPKALLITIALWLVAFPITWGSGAKGSWAGMARSKKAVVDARNVGRVEHLGGVQRYGSAGFFKGVQGRQRQGLTFPFPTSAEALSERRGILDRQATRHYDADTFATTPLLT